RLSEYRLDVPLSRKFRPDLGIWGRCPISGMAFSPPPCTEVCICCKRLIVDSGLLPARFGLDSGRLRGLLPQLQPLSSVKAMMRPVELCSPCDLSVMVSAVLGAPRCVVG